MCGRGKRGNEGRAGNLQDKFHEKNILLEADSPFFQPSFFPKTPASSPLFLSWGSRKIRIPGFRMDIWRQPLESSKDFPLRSLWDSLLFPWLAPTSVDPVDFPSACFGPPQLDRHGQGESVSQDKVPKRNLVSKGNHFEGLTSDTPDSNELTHSAPRTRLRLRTPGHMAQASGCPVKKTSPPSLWESGSGTQRQQVYTNKLECVCWRCGTRFKRKQETNRKPS